MTARLHTLRHQEKKSVGNGQNRQPLNQQAPQQTSPVPSPNPSPSPSPKHSDGRRVSAFT